MKTKLKKLLLTLLLMYASFFPKSGLITDCTKDYDYDSNDEYQMFI
jgi:hypothetical protein